MIEIRDSTTKVECKFFMSIEIYGNLFICINESVGRYIQSVVFKMSFTFLCEKYN